MLKLTVAVLAVVLAGSATAAVGWKSLRIDGSSEAAFARSLDEFKDKLSPARRSVFGDALKEIWLKGTKDAEAVQREYTADEYYRQLDGLGYEEVVTFTDPTGDWAQVRYRAAKDAAFANRYASAGAPHASGSPFSGNNPAPMFNDNQVRGTTNPYGDANSRAACSCLYPGL